MIRSVKWLNTEEKLSSFKLKELSSFVSTSASLSWSLDHPALSIFDVCLLQHT